MFTFFGRANAWTMATRGGSAPAMDTSRRIFRGRGGPTDRRLPKHEARRRKQAPREESKKSKYLDNDVAVVVPNVEERTVQAETKDDTQSDGISSCNMEEGTTMNEDETVATNSQADEEIKHLIRRVRNVRESIQFSAAANVNPSTWQQNVLNPVRNCVGEWRAIVNHYQQGELDPSICKAPALTVFELIQMSLQIGPLAGAKPGYFKRCGSDVAIQALEFLNRCVADKEEAAFLHFTEKQVDAIAKWKGNATKAVENDKLPSKTITKKQSKLKRK